MSKPQGVTVTLVPAVDSTMVDLAKLFNRSFEDYVVEFNIDSVWLCDRIRTDGIDLAASRLLELDGRVVGLGLISRRGWTGRLAAMGVVREARGGGVGRSAMEGLLKESRARGERAMVLEVIEQNSRAVRLYERCGFRVVNRLVGFRKESPEILEERSRDPLPGGPELEPIDVYEAGRQMLLGEPDNFPWQLRGETMTFFGPPYSAFRLEGASVILSDPAKREVVLRGLTVEPSRRRQGRARRLIETVLEAYPGRLWKVPSIVPEESAAAVFEGLGFEREKLTQFQMRVDFGS